MYAVVRTGGKQYRVSKDEILKVESLPGDIGAKVDFEVLMLGGDAP
jgi:large subunit ribosomal protein L21